MCQLILSFSCFLLIAAYSQAQFVAEFSEPTASFQENGLPGWVTQTGDGNVTFTQKIEDGYAALRVDASEDRRNIWYAFMHTDVSEDLNIKQLHKKHHALRIEARVRPGHAPRRVNLYLSTPRSTDHHSNLLEYDLPVANEWYTISMTLDSFDVREDELLYGQISMMDWGNSGTYQLDVDYMKVSIVDTLQAEADKGFAVRYRPPLADPESFAITKKVSEDVSIDSAFPDLNLSQWVHQEEKVLPMDATKTILLKWDFSDLKGQQVSGEGQLEFYTHAVQRLKENPKDFGELRIVEIIAGDKDWQEEEVTFQSLMQGQAYPEVINEQTTVDTPLSPGKGSKTTITLSQYVLQRLLDGSSSGLAIRPLGLINASLMDADTDSGSFAAILRFNTVSKESE